jgi:hypothetical protein
MAHDPGPHEPHHHPHADHDHGHDHDPGFVGLDQGVHRGGLDVALLDQDRFERPDPQLWPGPGSIRPIASGCSPTAPRRSASSASAAAAASTVGDHDHVLAAAAAEAELADRRGAVGEQPLAIGRIEVRALESILVEKGYVEPAAMDALIETYETRIGPRNGARLGGVGDHDHVLAAAAAEAELADRRGAVGEQPLAIPGRCWACRRSGTSRRPIARGR